MTGAGESAAVRRGRGAAAVGGGGVGAYTAGMALPDALTRALRAAAERDGDVRALYVFGSRTDGTARPDSDLDVGVLYGSRQPTAKTIDLEDSLRRAAGAPVDLVDAARAAPFLALAVVRGERIFARREVEADLFDLYVLRRAGDLLPFERARQALLLAPRT